MHVALKGDDTVPRTIANFHGYPIPGPRSRVACEPSNQTEDVACYRPSAANAQVYPARCDIWYNNRRSLGASCRFSKVATREAFLVPCNSAANTDVLAFYTELPFNYRDSARDHAKKIRNAHQFETYPPLMPLRQR